MGLLSHAVQVAYDVQVIMPQMPGHALAIAGKVGLDQLLYTPICTAVFFAWVNAMSGAPDKIGCDINNKLLPSCYAAWCLWVPASSINMAVVPTHLRMLFINAVSLVWTNILSRMATVDARTEENLAVLPAVSLAPAWRTRTGDRRRACKSHRSTNTQPVNPWQVCLPM
jgi:Mpv17 / PMP22 family